MYLRLGTPPIYHTLIPEGIPLDQDGLKWGGGEDFVLVLRDSIFSNFFVLWETCFLTKFASLGLPFLVPFGGLSFGALLFFSIVQLVSFLVSSSFLFRFMATP